MSEVQLLRAGGTLRSRCVKVRCPSKNASTRPLLKRPRYRGPSPAACSLPKRLEFSSIAHLWLQFQKAQETKCVNIVLVAACCSLADTLV